MLRDEIKGIMNTGVGTKKQIAEYLLNNATKNENFDIKDVARNTYTSESSVVRFAQKLGFSKWGDFIKAYIKEEIYFNGVENVNVNLPFTKDVINNILSLEINSLKFTQNLIDEMVIEKIAMTILDSRRTVLFSLQPNYYLAKSFERKMLSIGKNIEVAEVGEFGLKAASLNDGDSVIFISYSGSEFIEFVSQIKKIKNKKVKIIAITSSNDNYLKNNADYTIEIPTSEHLSSKISNYSSEIAIKFILDIIFSIFFQYRFDENLRFKINNSIDLEKERYNKDIER